MDLIAKVELFEDIRREYQFGIGTINGVAHKLGVELTRFRKGIGLGNLLLLIPQHPVRNRIDEGIGPSRASLRYGPQQTAGSLRTTPQAKTEDGPMQSYYVGLDVHSRESVFVVKNEVGAILARGSVPTTVNGLKHLRDSCGLPTATDVALETGTSAFFMARELARLELEPVVIDAHEVRRKAQRPEQKSDTRDALELCEGLRRGFYRSLVHVPSPAISDLRTTLSRRRHFIRIQTAEVNAVRRLLRGVGRNSGRRGSLRTDAHWQSLLAGDLVPEQL